MAGVGVVDLDQYGISEQGGGGTGLGPPVGVPVRILARYTRAGIFQRARELC